MRRRRKTPPPHPREPERTECLDANEAERRLRAIHDLHTPWQPGGVMCAVCVEEPWPCETRRLADDLPEPPPPPARLCDGEPSVRELREWGLLP